MSIADPNETILVIILIIFLLGGFSGNLYYNLFNIFIILNGEFGTGGTNRVYLQLLIRARTRLSA